MRKKYLITIITILVITLFSLEIFFRLLSKIEGLQKYTYLSTNVGRKTGLYQQDEYLGWKLRPNYNEKAVWPHTTTTEKINSQGWRDKEYSIEKPNNNVYRIVMIGCSRTYGYGANAEETFSKVLEKRLNLNSLVKFEVLNFGVNGYGLSQMALNCRHFVYKYKPDLVILQLYSPSIFRVLFTKRWGAQKPTYFLDQQKLKLKNYPISQSILHPFETWLMEHSMSYRIFSKLHIQLDSRIKWKRYGNNLFENNELHNLCSAILRDLNKAILKNNSRLIVFVWSERWMEILKNAGIEIFNLNDYENPVEWKKKGALDNPPPVGHWSPLGHQFVASAINKYLIQNRILPNISD